eukprot:GFYU01006566.1.p1 GENE.GFYU01006566.1~~GFYU01006566.1.p1  ORF type:complete len:264 (-),score=67.19 GFYU01006566.1:91-828(-)
MEMQLQVDHAVNRYRKPGHGGPHTGTLAGDPDSQGDISSSRLRTLSLEDDQRIAILEQNSHVIEGKLDTIYSRLDSMNAMLYKAFGKFDGEYIEGGIEEVKSLLKETRDEIAHSVNNSTRATPTGITSSPRLMSGYDSTPHFSQQQPQHLTQPVSHREIRILPLQDNTVTHSAPLQRKELAGSPHSSIHTATTVVHRDTSPTVSLRSLASNNSMSQSRDGDYSMQTDASANSRSNLLYRGGNNYP